MRYLLCFAAFFLASCGPSTIIIQSASSLREQQSFVTANADQSMTADAQADMQTLFKETRRIILSSEFRKNLLLVKKDISQAPFGRRFRPKTIHDVLLGKVSGYTYAPTTMRWDDKGGNTNSVIEGKSIIDLTNSVRTQWISTDLKTKSLAINSMAHELTHSLSSDPNRLVTVFSDTFYSLAARLGSKPVASYTVGTVAQCTWLAAADANLDLAKCYERYGLKRFTP